MAFIGALGKSLYLVVFSIISLVALIFVGWAYANAPYWELWALTPALRWAALIAMPLACFLVVAGASSPNPFSLGVGGHNFDPGRPGIVRIAKHPLIWGLLTWSSVHILVNGDVASLILFGSMSLMAVMGPYILNQRMRRLLGADVWDLLSDDIRRTSVFTAVLQVGTLRFMAAGAFYILLLAAHGPVIGVSPAAGLWFD